MAMRRPRIKPVANILLNSKRKPKPSNDVNAGNVGESDGNNSEGKKEDIKKVIPSQEKETSSIVANLLEVRVESTVDTKTNRGNLNKDKTDCEINYEEAANLKIVKAELSTAPKCENYKIVADVEDSTKNFNEFLSKKVSTKVKETIINDSKAFKCPPKVGFQRAVSQASNSGLDDVFYSDIEENALQMDLEKSPSNLPASPSKNMARPRIRPTPHFGQRRNSYVGSSPSPHSTASEDIPFSNSTVNNDVIQTTQTRRERHHSASISGNNHSLHHHTPHKYFPAGITNSSMGRIRTESGCSVFSDNTSSHKLRKIDDHKQTARKDYEARFHKGVPEKSLIKMSDLIFYNPVTNPMEQKPIPNVKLEQKETSSNDVKPFIGKTDTETNTFTDDTEAVPVPQLKLNAKGELILDDKSLVIETTAEQEARKALASSSLIYLDEYTGMNGFYSRKSRTRVWLHSDTIKFYRCLQNVGTDFSLMVSLFPNRTRRDLKLKFKKEERKNGHLISKALLYPKQFDIEALKQQIDEEEKLKGEQVKDKKKKPKKEKKKINCQSKATRILSSGVYQNENNQIEKTIGKSDDVPLIVKTAHIDPIQIDKSDKVEHEESEKKIKLKKTKEPIKSPTEVEKLIRDYDYEKRKRDRYYAIKRRRKRRHYKRQMRDEVTVVKEEIKVENKQEPNDSEFQDTMQLEMEMDDLLDMDAVDAQYDNDTYKTSTSHMFTNTSQVSQYNEQIDATSQIMSHAATPFPDIANENKQELENYEHKTFVNSDDGSLTVYSNIKDNIVFIAAPQRSTSLSPTENENHSFAPVTTELETTNIGTCTSVRSEPELNEADIQSILTELAEGSLVLVSSLDPDDPDKVLNEIYMVDKSTGDLCEEPLNIPDNIVQCILAVAS